MTSSNVLALGAIDLGCYGVALQPGFVLPRHLEVLVECLESIERGETKRLIVSMPPRHGKSLLTSTLFPAWYLGRHPDRQLIFASYGQELADDFGRKVRNLCADPRHRAIFPASALSNDSAAAHRFSTTAGGSYVAVGRGGAITGRGADLLLIDDPIKDREEANSATIRRQLQQWYAEVGFTRLQPGGAVVIISTRWHEDDLVGWLLQEHIADGWKVLCLPALAEAGDALGRAEGDALWPDRFPVGVLDAIKAQLGNGAFAALYQQRPVALEGAIFKREWWKYYRGRIQGERLVLSVDSAFKTGQQNDFSVITVWLEARNGYYLGDLWRNRVEFPELKRAVAALADKWSPVAVLVEDRASGQSLIQELRRDTRLPIKACSPERDKVSRAHAITPLVEAGKVFLPERALWLADYLDEMSSFPVGPYDDAVDSTVQALLYLRENQGWGSPCPPGTGSSITQPLTPYQRAELVELPEGYRPPVVRR
jgi:predicted phage terminase large subunit-like protein